MDREILCSSRTLRFPTRAQWHLLCTLAAIIEPAVNRGGFKMRSTTVCSKTSRDQAKSLCIDAATFRARSGGVRASEHHGIAAQRTGLSSPGIILWFQLARYLR